MKEKRWCDYRALHDHFKHLYGCNGPCFPRFFRNSTSPPTATSHPAELARNTANCCLAHVRCDGWLQPKLGLGIKNNNNNNARAAGSPCGKWNIQGRRWKRINREKIRKWQTVGPPEASREVSKGVSWGKLPKKEATPTLPCARLRRRKTLEGPYIAPYRYRGTPLLHSKQRTSPIPLRSK